MAGTREGGKKAAETNIKRHGEDFYKRIGAMGGRSSKANGTIKGFAARPDIAREAGRKGGMISKRRKYDAF